jgi:hypothetical protein
MLPSLTRRSCFCFAILTIASPEVVSAASQLAPFFEGLKNAQGVEARKAYLKAERRSPEALVLSEEFPALLAALRDSDPLANYLAGQYLSDMAGRYQRDPGVQEGYRAVLPALAAHFNDPNPDPDVEVAFFGQPKENRWQAIVLNYLKFTELPMPPDLIPSAEAALHGPHYHLAIEELARLKPLPTGVLRALLGVIDNAPHEAAGPWVISRLSENGVTDPLFVKAIIRALSSSNKDLMGVAAVASLHLGTAVAPAAPALRRIVQDNRLSGDVTGPARRVLEAIEEGKPPGDLSPSLPEPVDPKTPAEPDRSSMRVAPHFELLRTAKSEDRRRLLKTDLKQGSWALTLVPEEDVTVLINALNGGDPDLAAVAARYLVTMACQNSQAGSKVRETIAAALPAMTKHYDDENAPVLSGELVISNIWRNEVMMFVWMTGQPPSPPLASKILSNLQKDYEDHRAVWATYALVQLKPIPKEILSAVLAKARNVTEDIKVQIIGALTASDPDLVNELAAILDDPAERHQDAVMALSDLGIAAKDAEPALRRFAARAFPTGSEDANAQVYARLALKALGAQ